MTALERRSDAPPMFKQLARMLAEPIASGAIPVGGRLPTEAELAQRYGVSRHTVREAVAELRALGLIESRQGIGSVVLRNQPQRGDYVETFSSVDDLIRFGRFTPLRTQSISEIVADTALAEVLRGRPDQSYLKITGLRYDRADAQGQPAGHVEVFVDLIYAGIADALPHLKTAVAEAIASQYGISIARVDQELTAVRLPRQVAMALECDPRTPAMLLSRWYYGPAGRIFEVARSYFPTGRFTYRSSLVRSTGRQIG